MKFVGTSNSAFLIPPGSAAPSSPIYQGSEIDGSVVVESMASVLKIAPGTMELVQAALRLDKLRILLNQRPYSLDEDLGSDPQSYRGLYSWQDLFELIQASEEELRAGLRSLLAVGIDGYWRIVDQKSMNVVLDMILNNSILYEWPLNALSEDQVVSALVADAYSPRIILHCLDTYGSKTESMEGHLWRLDEKRMCLHRALQVLSRGKMKLRQFYGEVGAKHSFWNARRHEDARRRSAV